MDWAGAAGIKMRLPKLILNSRRRSPMAEITRALIALIVRVGVDLAKNVI